jgi:hypothetical protein
MLTYADSFGRRAPSPGRSDGAASSAEIGDSAAPQRAKTSRLARSGEQRSGAPPVGLGLDDKPRGAILPDCLGEMACAHQRTTGECRGRRNAANSFFVPARRRPAVGRAGGRLGLTALSADSERPLP